MNVVNCHINFTSPVDRSAHLLNQGNQEESTISKPLKEQNDVTRVQRHIWSRLSSTLCTKSHLILGLYPVHC